MKEGAVRVKVIDGGEEEEEEEEKGQWPLLSYSFLCVAAWL